MNIRVVTLRYSETLGGFPEEPLRQVVAGANVLEQREYFFILTSQWFGNLYLDETDHWIKEVRRAPGYVRYMDDLVVWSDNKAWLWALADDLAEHVASTRSLELKAARTLVAPCSVGVPLLGYRVFPALIRHQGTRARRRRRLFREREAADCCGELTAEQLTACARSISGSRQFLHAGEALRSEIEL